MISYSICLSLTYFTWHNALQVHSCCCKWQNFILSYDWVVFHYINISHRLCPFICWRTRDANVRPDTMKLLKGHLGRTLFDINHTIFFFVSKWQPTPVLLPGKSHGRRSLVGYSPWGRKESDTTERLHFLSKSKRTKNRQMEPN